MPTHPDPKNSFTRKCQSEASDERMRWVVVANTRRKKDESEFSLMEIDFIDFLVEHCRRPFFSTDMFFPTCAHVQLFRRSIYITRCLRYW